MARSDEPEQETQVRAYIEALSKAQAESMPRLDFAAIPDAEKDAASSIQHCLWNLEQFTRSFQSALALFQHSYAQFLDEMKRTTVVDISERRPDDPSKGWMSIAGRDGAMSIYHFGTAANGVRPALGICRALGGNINHGELRAALRDFRDAFPLYVDMRDAVAHAADKLLSPSKMREHTPANRVVIADSFAGSRFTTTWEGKTLSYDLTQGTLDNLEATRRRIWALFR